MSGPANQIALAASETASVFDTYTKEQIAIIKTNVAQPDMSDAQLAYCLTVAKARNLDPFKKQVYFSLRKKRDANGNYVSTVTVEPTIDGFRSMAEETGELDGYDGPYFCGPDGVWTDVWLENTPLIAAKIVVYRKGKSRGFTATARLSAYMQTDYKTGQANHMWAKMGDNQLAKCAEALALRKAFPSQLGQFYTREEMGQADQPNQFANLPQEVRNEEQRPAVVLNLPPAIAQQAPAVQQSAPVATQAVRTGAAPRPTTPPIAQPPQQQAAPAYRERPPQQQERPVARQADGLPNAWTSADPIPESIRIWCKPLQICGERTIYQLTIAELELVVEQAAQAYARAEASTKGTKRLLEILDAIGSASELLLTQRLAEGAQ